MRFRRAVWAVSTGIMFVLLNGSTPAFSAPPTKKPVATPAVEEEPTVPADAAKLIDEAISKAQSGKFAEAIDLLQQSIAIIEKKYGKEHYLTGHSLNILTEIEMVQGHLDKAEEICERTIRILKKDINGDPLRLATAFSNRGELFGKRGIDDGEIELHKLALLLLDKAYTPESPSANAEVLSLARILRKWGRYAEARIYFERWLVFIEKKFGPNESELVPVLLDLAMNEADSGHYAYAEKLLQRAQDIRKTQGLTKDADIATILNNLGEVKYQSGDYVAAEALFQRVLVVFEADPATNPYQMGVLLGNVGSLRLDRGDSNGGVPLLRRSLEIQEKYFGADSPWLVTPLTNLGEALLRLRQYDECTPLLERALTIREKALGPDHPKLAAPLVNIGSVWLEQNNVQRAEPYFIRALEIQEKKLGPTNPLLFPTLQALGIIEQGRNNLDEAEKFHQRAADVLEKAFGPTHPNIIAPLRSLATIQRLRGKLDDSRKTLQRASDIGEKTTQRMLAGGSEEQKLAWLSTLDPLWEQIVEHHLRFEPKIDEAATLAFEATLRRKGRALDAVAGSLSLLRRNMSPEVQTIFEQLRDRQKKLAALMMRATAEKDASVWVVEVQALEKEVASFEALLAEKSAAYRIETQNATVGTVQAMLPADTIYVEIIRRRLAAVGYFNAGTPEQYAAYVLGQTGGPRIIDLGDAGPIDEAVFKLRDALSDPSRDDTKSLSRALDEKVMRPIRAELGSSKRLVISPDGNLNFIPFEALVDEKGQYLIERWSISYVTSGRDLFRWSRHASSRSGPVIVANPAFGEIVKRSAGETNAAARGVDRTGISRLGFTPLAGTAQEGQAILKQLSGAKLFAGDEASKEHIASLAGPKVLHIATHGFFLGDTLEMAAQHTRGFTIEGDDAQPVVRSIETAKAPAAPSPLLRSGLALSGANARGSERSNGILTAFEASGLDLEGTKLVVLSACETGLGQARSGEGVEGLRRAFVLAGAETTVMSLWKVADSETRDMMIAYYRRLEGSEGRSEALRQVRLGMLANSATAHPFYWASFIVAGDPSRFDGTIPSVPPVRPSARGCACTMPGYAANSDDLGFVLIGMGIIVAASRRRLS